jgi:hypothetical protein
MSFCSSSSFMSLSKRQSGPQLSHTASLLPAASSFFGLLATLCFSEHALARRSESGLLFVSFFAMSFCRSSSFMSLSKCQSGPLLSHTASLLPAASSFCGLLAFFLLCQAVEVWTVIRRSLCLLAFRWFSLLVRSRYVKPCLAYGG